MSDIFKNDLIDADFVAGEQPTYIKLTAVVSQLRTSINRLNRGVGDLYTQQTHIGSSGQYSIDSIPTAGPNISRMIGSSGWLNPIVFGRQLVTKTVVFVGHRSISSDPPEIKGFDHFNRREFKLPDWPIVYTSTEGAETLGLTTSHALGGAYWSIGAPGGSYVDVSATATANPVASLSLVNSTGDYHISSDGIITLFDPLDDNDGFAVTYKFHPVFDSYDGASLNVIPDFSQTATLCAVALITGSTYSIGLPLYTGHRGWPIASNWSPPDEFFTYDNVAGVTAGNLNQQLLLPFVLRQNLSAGDVVPEGYISLWDETDGTTVDGIEFTYVDTYTVNATGVTLTASTDRYRLVVSGCNIGRTIDRMRDNQYWHDHSGRQFSIDGLNMGQRIHHYDMLNLIDEGDDGSVTSGFTVSTAGVTRNPHSQYLHRYGWQYNNSISDPGNVDNSMLGSILFASTQNNNDLADHSYSLFFGGSPLSSVGGRIRYFTGSPGYLEISEGNVSITEDLAVTGTTLLTDTLTASNGLRTHPGNEVLKHRMIQYLITGTDVSNNACNLSGTLGGIGDNDDESYIAAISGTIRNVSAGNGTVIGSLPITDLNNAYFYTFALTSGTVSLTINFGAGASHTWSSGDVVNVLITYSP